MAPIHHGMESFERRPIGWCPSCRKRQACIPLQALESHPAAYNCAACGGAMPDPIIRLVVPFRDSGLAAEGL